MFCALVLAAGRSRRMGTQKLLLPLGGQSAIVRIVDALRQSPVDQVFVVLGPDGASIVRALAERPVSWVINPNTESEMIESVRCGLRALPSACTAVLVALGDQPGITSEFVTRMICAFQQTGAGIVQPVHGGRQGHPLLIAMRYRDEILSCHDGVGLRGLLQAHATDAKEIEIDDPALLEDMDHPADYAKLAARCEARGSSSVNRKD
jgi:molybdenum cofactor cytidylyltransferase